MFSLKGYTVWAQLSVTDLTASALSAEEIFFIPKLPVPLTHLSMRADVNLSIETSEEEK